ncbi:MAG TPA: protein translocase subunit SecD [Gammaproteobacteria bacterium]|jgi:preprotein translocase subunit SecD|nr:protein translocase subunit SecD [Gammaproteobacteria bacterium]
MNRFPLWKNVMVFTVVFVSAVLALPNLFGEDEAVQVSRADGVAMDAAALEQTTKALMAAGVSYKSATIEKNVALILFPTVEDQLRASTALQKALPNHVVALTLTSRTPAWLRAIGLKPMALGLDLRGGVHFLYQVDLNAAIRQYLSTYESDLRTQLREAKIRNDVRVVADASSPERSLLQVAIIEPGDLTRAEQIIKKLDSGDQLIQLGKTSSRLIVDPAEIDGRQGFKIRLSEAAIRERQDFAIQQNTVTLRNRVNALGVAEAVVQRQGLDRILVQLPGVQDPAQAKRVLGSTATLEWHLVDTENDAAEAERRGRAPLGLELEKHKDGRPFLLRRDVIASGDQMVDATSTYSQGQPVVQVRLNARGGEKMLQTTSGNVGKPMGVLFIEEKPKLVERDGKMVLGEPDRTETVISVATIQGVFSNRFVITGLTPFEANDLALLLRAGSLAAPIVPVEEKTIGPSLGQDNIDRGVRATIAGYVIVVLFIAFWYRLFGVIADIALFANVLMLIAAMSAFQAQLSLPGIAGIVLTVGMAVDANVLIFERIREELRNGNTPQASIRAGFDRAFSTIVDANVTTFIAAAVLFVLGSGPVKGFAVTMGIGILTSIFTSVTVTRAMVNLVYGSRPHLKSLSIGGGAPPSATPAPAR